ncbi:MAG: T9SS type A sorting domain-containing protein, partial [Candidatus Cloacimonadota bacterium]
YSVQLDTMRGTTAADVRAHLLSLLPNELEGAILIGSIPFAWYEYTSAEGREEFPVDLYLMDLDGTWIDNDGDGLFDNHTGSKAPEIWTGRIFSGSMSWSDEIILINSYLSKIHKYRTGGYSTPQKALAYVDDDWYGYNDCDLGLLYDTVDVVRNYNTTIASDFRIRFNDPYEWVQICSHSSPWGNTFKNQSGYAGTCFNFEIWFANPEWQFINLFQCSGTRFFEENYSGGCYIFGPMNTLLVIGSSKVGSMRHFDDFYGPLAGGISVGEAFKDWFSIWGINDVSWYYGMIICGDAALKPKSGSAVFARSGRKGLNLYPADRWSSPQPIDTDPETDGFCDVAVDGNGRIWAAWVTGRSQSNGRTEICVSYNENNSWSSPEIIDPFLYWDWYPTLCADATGAMWLSWARCYGRNYDIFACSYDGGWNTPDHISSRSTDAVAPAMTCDGGGRLWITLERWNHLNGDIYCRYYDGSSWQPMFAVTIGSVNDYKPAMATDSTGMAWTAWTSERWQENKNIYVKNYNESSGHWENIRRVTGNIAQDQDPAITVDGDGTIWVAWTTWRNGNSDIYQSHYDGASWSAPQSITTNPERDEQPALAVDQDGYLWCIWQSDRTGDWEIFAKYYKDGEWGDSMNVSINANRDIFPEAALDDSGKIWLLRQSDRNANWDIYASTILSDLIPPTVAVTIPNGGEVWNIGEVNTIEWIATDNIGIDSVSIQYSTNGGGNWIPVANGEVNDSSYDWTIPPTPSTNCLVKVIAFDGFENSGEDISDSPFTIRDGIPPAVQVHMPNGGEILSIGIIDTITWLASDNIGVDSIRLEYSINGGGDWIFITSPPAQDTLYEWIVPPTPSTTCLMKVIAFDAELNFAEDESDSFFEIRDDSLPAITVIAPNGGEIWIWNDIHDIQWDSNDNVGIDSLNITLSLDGGSTFPLFVAHIDGDDSIFQWTIPETTSTECIIKVEGYDGAENVGVDVSDSVFTIAQTGVQGSNRILPGVTMLRSITPNPFRLLARIDFQIARKTTVTIHLYDVRGRLVNQIENKMYKPGYYSINIKQPLSSGVYFIKMSAGSKLWTQKIIRIK